MNDTRYPELSFWQVSGPRFDGREGMVFDRGCRRQVAETRRLHDMHAAHCEEPECNQNSTRGKRQGVADIWLLVSVGHMALLMAEATVCRLTYELLHAR